MVNQLIKAQIDGAKTYATAFVQGCQVAAMRDDARISKDEAKVLKRIEKATKRFLADLDKAIM